MDTATRNKHELSQQFLFFNFAYGLGTAVAWSYYAILLLRESDNNIAPVFISQAVIHLATLLGFFISGHFFHVLGYLRSFQVNTLLHGAVGLLALLTADNILNVFIIISALRGLANGFFWNTRHTYNTQEITGTVRARLLSTMHSMFLLLEVLLPVFVGTIISTQGYAWVFGMGVAIYTLATIYPWHYNKIPRDKLGWKDALKLSRRHGFRRWAAVTISEEVLTDIRTASFMILPFLFIGDEMGVGVLGSTVGVVAAALTFTHRNDDNQHRIRNGYVGASIVGVLTTMLILIWSLPALIIRNLGVTLGLALFIPAHQDLVYRNRELVMGDFKEEYGVEVQIYSEIFLVIARIAVLAMVAFALYGLRWNQEATLKALLLITVGRELIAIALNVSLEKFLRRGSDRTAIHVPVQADPHKKPSYV